METRPRLETSASKMGSRGMVGAEVIPTRNVFVYGTLMAEEVVHVLLSRFPPSSPALLHRYERYSIRGRAYPAIVPVQGHTVSGKVLLGLADHELDILDIYEDTEYERKVVTVTNTDSWEQLTAYAYVWKNHSDHDLYGEWNFEEWKQRYINKCIKMTKEFMEEFETNSSVVPCESSTHDEGPH